MSHLLLPIPFQPLLLREYHDVLKQQYTKRFTLTPCDPPGETDIVYKATYWKDERLQSMKKRLNETKSQLNNMPLDKWHRHTRKLNPAALVPASVKKSANPELLTQAWLKFHECFHVFSLGPGPETKQFTSVHLCEAPGAFITSLNHALVLQHPEVVWNWMATTLNPHYEGNDLGYMINDDRFIMGSLDHWNFGVDNTGNLLMRENMEHLVRESGKLSESGTVDLVTADGSVDCQSDPGRQESIVADLHLAEAVTALNMLTEGGNFVLKMFTIFESETVCLLFLLNCAFESIDIFKPATSKEGNSEVYVICKEYKKSKWLTSILESLSDCYGDFPLEKSLFPKDIIPESFLSELKKCGDLFMQLQENVISNNLHYWNDQLAGNDMKDLAEVQTQVAEKYMAVYKVEEIPSYRYCVYRRRDPSISQIDARVDRGTFIDKLEEGRMEAGQRLEAIRRLMKGWKVKGRVRFVEWVPSPKLGEQLKEPVLGKKVKTVLSSKFCTGRHLELFNDTKKCLEDLEDDDSGSSKRRKLDKSSKPYQSKCRKMSDYLEDVRILNKLSKIYPDILDVSNVLFLDTDESFSKNMLNEECKTDNQIRLIGTIIEAVTSLKKGNHLLVQGFPLHTRLTTTIFYCLAALFEEVGFVRPYETDDFIFLSNFLGSATTAEATISSLESLLTVLYSHKAGPEQVLSVWSVEDLVQDRIYQEIILFNQTRIKEQILYLTKFLEPKKEETDTVEEKQ